MKVSKSIRKQIFDQIWDAEYSLEFGQDARDHISNYIIGIERGMTPTQMKDALITEISFSGYRCSDGGLTAFGCDAYYQTSLFINKFEQALKNL